MKQETRNNMAHVARNYEGNEKTRIETLMIANTMFGTGMFDEPAAPTKQRRALFAIHGITLVPTQASQNRIDKALDKAGFRIDAISQDSNQAEQYANVYYPQMERFTTFVEELQALQEMGPLECLVVPVYLDMNGARFLVYSQTSTLYNRDEVRKDFEDWLIKRWPRFAKTLGMEIETTTKIFERGE